MRRILGGLSGTHKRIATKSTKRRPNNRLARRAARRRRAAPVDFPAVLCKIARFFETLLGPVPAGPRCFRGARRPRSSLQGLRLRVARHRSRGHPPSAWRTQVSRVEALSEASSQSPYTRPPDRPEPRKLALTTIHMETTC